MLILYSAVKLRFGSAFPSFWQYSQKRFVTALRRRIPP